MQNHIWICCFATRSEANLLRNALRIATRCEAKRSTIRTQGAKTKFERVYVCICIGVYVCVCFAMRCCEAKSPRSMWFLFLRAECVAVCCSVLQCVAECCSVLQCAAVCCSVCSVLSTRKHLRTVLKDIKLSPVLNCVAVSCGVLQSVAVCFAVWCSMLQCAPVCCSVLQCVAECCRVLQCVAVCCSVL